MTASTPEQAGARSRFPNPGVAAGAGPGVIHPAKFLRIASVARAMLEEARSSSCDAQGCIQLRAIYQCTLEELGQVLSADLMDELSNLVAPFSTEPLEPAEIRLAQAELVGWLEGLFSGIVAVVNTQDPDVAGSDDQDGRADLQESGRLPGNYL